MNTHMLKGTMCLYTFAHTHYHLCYHYSFFSGFLKDLYTTLNKTSGWISAPGLDEDGEYDHNLDCYWIVQYGESYTVLYQFLYVMVEYTYDCENDYLYVSYIT